MLGPISPHSDQYQRAIGDIIEHACASNMLWLADLNPFNCRLA